jgi:outer membrane protein OmpA-like peptidoglycan-associated protein
MITPQLTAPLAAKLGESEQSVQRGIETGSAAMLSTLAGRASESGFLSEILKLVTSSGAQMAMGAAAGSGTTGGISTLATSFLSQIFGSGQAGVQDMIARTAAIRPSSASAILGAAAPLVMGMLGQRVSSGGLGAASLAGMLTAELPRLQGLLPTGWSAITTAAQNVIPDKAETTGNRWLWPLLLLAALLAIGLYWFLGRGAAPVTEVATKVAETATTATSTVTDAAKTAIAALGEFFKRRLPDGVELNIPRLGIENKLITFIEDTSKPVDKTTWFDFDRLLFDTGQSTLQPSSAEQLQNIAAILKAYPKVQIKIGGYTDNTGTREANLKLSADRANSVMGELVKLGVAPARLTAEGYGDAYPVADNATEEGRAQNRRIAIRVTRK